MLKKLRFSEILNPTRLYKGPSARRRPVRPDSLAGHAEKASVFKDSKPDPTLQGSECQKTPREAGQSRSLGPEAIPKQSQSDPKVFPVLLKNFPSYILEFVEKASVFRDSKPDALCVATGSNPKVIPKRSQSNPRVIPKRFQFC